MKICALFVRTIGVVALSSAIAIGPTTVLADSGPRVRIDHVGRVQLTGDHATLDVTLDVRNPTGLNLTLQALHFNCSFNDLVHATGDSTAAVSIASNSEAMVPVRMIVKNDSIVALLSLIGAGAPLHYQLDGTAEIEPMGLNLPFTQHGEIPIAQ